MIKTSKNNVKSKKFEKDTNKKLKKRQKMPKTEN